ncbi:MAG: OsmC family protein [Acidobacteriota bacterium]|nr:MAG: OsmC family protein [Acidobacteriota bacterium]
MSDVNIKMNWDGGLRFTGINGKGHETRIDGDKETAPTPMEILLEAIGSCSAIDVVIIMEKVRTPLRKLEISLEGNRHHPEPRYYTDIRINFDAWGDGINPDKLERAINLSIIKYCSVFHSLRPDIDFRVGYRIHSPEGEAAGDYTAVELEPES